MRITVEAEKIGMKVGVEEIVEWNNDIETKLDEADKEIEKARKCIGDYKKKAEAEAQEEELRFQEKLHQTKLKYEAELQAAKSTQSQHEPGESTTLAVGAKLPKLVISKFNGTYMDWPRFWGQFTETIDKSNIAAVSKFAYLRELLDSKVKKHHRSIALHGGRIQPGQKYLTREIWQGDGNCESILQRNP